MRFCTKKHYYVKANAHTPLSEIVKPSVTHKTIPVKEVIQDQSQNHGVTTKEPISVGEFSHRLDGEKKSEHKVSGDLPSEK